VFYADREYIDFNDLEHKDEDLTIEFFDFNSKSKSELKNTLNKIVPGYRLQRDISRYDHKTHWELVIAYWRDVPVGCNWILNIPHDNFIFDSFIHDSGQVLLGSSFVVNEFRGRGINKLIRKKALKYVFENYENKLPVSIVEKSNISSIKSNYGVGAKLYGRNYLIKLLKHNIFSVLIKKDKTIKFWFLLKYKQTLY